MTIILLSNEPKNREENTPADMIKIRAKLSATNGLLTFAVAVLSEPNRSKSRAIVSR